MANVDILLWCMELMTALSERVVRPASLSELLERYPTISRNTLKNRLDTMVAAKWLLETQRGYIVHPEVARMYVRAQKSFYQVTAEAVETMKMFETTP